MKVVKITKNNCQQAIKKAVSVLKKNGLIIYPTETCYGLGVRATSRPAVTKLFKYKGKRANKPISIAVANQAMAAEYVQLNQTAKNLYQQFLPGPLTIVSQSKNKVDQRLQANQKTLAIRIPDFPLIIQLIKELAEPLTSTSANPSGQNSPYSIEQIRQNTSQARLKLVDLALDSGRLPNNPPSTVVKATTAKPTILRKGKITLATNQV